MIHYYAMPGIRKADRPPSVISPYRVIWQVANYFQVTPDAILNKFAGSSRARTMAMYLVKKMTILSFNQIAAMFHCRQHGAAIAACRTIERYVSSDPVYRNIVNEIESLI